jgi:hypothetical protein
MTEAEWLVATDPRAMFHWLRRSGMADRHRLGLFFVACCDLIPPSVAEEPGAGVAHWADDENGQIALTDAEFHLSGAVWEAMRSIGGGESQQTALVARIRDIFGNPFCPIAFSPMWRTGTAIALARQMSDSRDFFAMPILADALQDAGCDNTDILDHCRDTALTHVRGCWVVDLVLGKE